MKHCSRSALPVDEYVRDVVLERMSRPDAVALLSDNTRPDARKLRERAVALRARLDGLAAEFADADPEDPEAMTPREFRVAGDKLRQRLAEVEAQLADAGRVDVLGSLVHADDAARTWEDMSEARRRAIVDLLMTVTIHPPGKGVRTFRPESVGIEWKTDQEPEL